MSSSLRVRFLEPFLSMDESQRLSDTLAPSNMFCLQSRCPCADLGSCSEPSRNAAKSYESWKCPVHRHHLLTRLRLTPQHLSQVPSVILNKAWSAKAAGECCTICVWDTGRMPAAAAAHKRDALIEAA